MNQNTTVEPSAISRVHKLTYGLIYPAFIGNMIYDLIQFIFDANPDLKWTNQNFEILTGLMVVIFYSLDYILLHSDLDYKTTISQKDYIYTLGDFATSCLFFSTFVFSKYDKLDNSIVCLTLIPIIFSIYNWRLNIYKIFNLLFGIASFIIMSAYFYFKPNPETYFSAITFLFTLIYLLYNLFGFWLPPRRR